MPPLPVRHLAAAERHDADSLLLCCAGGFNRMSWIEAQEGDLRTRASLHCLRQGMRLQVRTAMTPTLY